MLIETTQTEKKLPIEVQIRFWYWFHSLWNDYISTDLSLS